MHKFIFLLICAIAACDERLNHRPETGPFDELSSEEIYAVYHQLGRKLNLTFIESHFFVPENVSLASIPLQYRTRVIHIALEVPPKHLRNSSNFTRLARVGLYIPGDENVFEFIVAVDASSVELVRRVPALKRPMDEIETGQLATFLSNTFSGDLEELLVTYFGARVMGLELGYPKCAGNGSHVSATPSSYPGCLFAMYSSPKVTTRHPGRRVSSFRFNRFVPPYNQHPIDVYVDVDHTDPDPANWVVISMNIQKHHFPSLTNLVAQKSNWDQLFKPQTNFTAPFQPYHTLHKGRGLCARKSDGNSTVRALPGTVLNKHVTYGHWSFDVGVRHETGLRFYNVRFKGELIMHEAGMDETVTIYGGESPFMRSMTSLESMFGVGSLTSELSPGIDCPVDAVFLSVPVIPSPSAGARTVRNGICIYESKADLHEGPYRRHFETFREEDGQPNMGYATGSVQKSLYVVCQATVYNYDYAFVNVFSPSGSYSSFVVPSGYIHVDLPVQETANPFGFVHPRLGLLLNIHIHHFLFYVDALGSANQVLQTRVFAEGERVDRMSLVTRHLKTESEGRLKGDDRTVQTAICKPRAHNASGMGTRCFKVMNFSPLKSMVTRAASLSFPWIRRAVWFTKYRANETRSSSIYNGVDLTEPLVDFSRFSNNESLEGDVVMWINVGFIHIPVSEDFPQTPSMNSQLGFTIRPANFFDPSAEPAPSDPGFVVTNLKEDWINGFEESESGCCDSQCVVDTAIPTENESQQETDVTMS